MILYDENYCQEIEESESIESLKNTIDDLLRVIGASGKVCQAMQEMLENSQEYVDAKGKEMLLSSYDPEKAESLKKLLEDYDNKIIKALTNG